ncbi:Uncharacterised protein [Mycobacteroides abscessus]|nr:Uncharacterised protein [Mycobacteroides abscessus]
MQSAFADVQARGDLTHGGYVTREPEQLVAYLARDAAARASQFQQLLALAHAQGRRVGIGRRQRFGQ